MIAVLPIHMGMVVGIGREHGLEVTKEVALDLIKQISTTVRLSLLSTTLATTAGKIFLPGFGGLAAAPFVFASTMALGKVANLYFRQRGDVSDAELRREFNAEMKRAGSDFDPARAKAVAQAKEEGGAHEDAAAPAAPAGGFAARLRELRARCDRGEIDVAAYEAAKQEVVRDL